jgi:hypothetical protein
MLDLEQAIADWRRQMLAAGIKTPVPLEELEIHLRDEIEEQIKSGLDGQEAFSSAVQKIGEAQMIQNEFEKQAPKPRNGAFDCASQFVNFGMIFAVGISLRYDHDAVFRGFGLLLSFVSLMGITASCIQAAEFYFGKRRRQTKSELNEPEAFSSTVTVQNIGQAPKFSLSMAGRKVRWSAPVKFVRAILMVFMIFMCLAWLVNVGFLLCILLRKIGPPVGEWNMFEFILICWIAVLAVTIPMQFVQIFRMWRALSEKSKDTLTEAPLR